MRYQFSRQVSAHFKTMSLVVFVLTAIFVFRISAGTEDLQFFSPGLGFVIFNLLLVNCNLSLPARYLGALKNLFKCVCAFKIELDFENAGF